jgi:heme exporter protein A
VNDRALLRFAEVGCVRGGRLLFEGLDLSLGAGEALLVTGANGAGKSSLIRVAGGLLRAAAGTVERHASATLADEALALDPKLTVAAALGFWARIDGVEAAPGMEAMGLARLAGVPVRMLSTGQRKRAALARVVASGAKLWLLDEPANGLDAEGEERLARVIAAHRADGGAVLAASHQPLLLGEHRVLAL